MYSSLYNEESERQFRENVKKLNEKIEEERKKDKIDEHKIMRLEEQKLMNQLFSNNLGSPFLKFRSPW